MGSSLREGLESLPADRDAVVIALVDQPLIGPETVRRLITAFAEGAEIAVACYEGRPRNPVLIARRYWGEAAAAAQGDAGARGFVRARQDLVRAVECADVGRPDDLDTPEDLARIAALVRDVNARIDPD
jgi:nicotine blue oxidoreductase